METIISISYYEIVDNFLPEDDFTRIVNIVTSYNFPYFYQNEIGYDNESDHLNCYFTHKLKDKFQPNSEFYNLFDCVTDKLNISNGLIYRIKVNCYPRTEKIIEHNPHIDYKDSHMAMILYLNSNNGFTRIDKDVKIDSIANRLLIFDGSIPHNSTNCTDQKARFTANFNIFGAQ
jgi:hypothetical protein